VLVPVLFVAVERLFGGKKEQAREPPHGREVPGQPAASRGHT
jgi:hypothetical protein